MQGANLIETTLLYALKMKMSTRRCQG
jgi:hypothetical protein